MGAAVDNSAVISFKVISVVLTFLTPLLGGSVPGFWNRIANSLLYGHSLVGGLLLGVSTVHLLSNASLVLEDFGVSLALGLSVLVAFFAEQCVRYTSYRWLPVDEQLRPSYYGEVVYPMLFDGSNHWFPAAAIFFGVTLQYQLTGLTMGLTEGIEWILLLSLLAFQLLAAASLGMTIERAVSAKMTRWQILIAFSLTAPVGLCLGWLGSLGGSDGAAAVSAAITAGFLLHAALMQVLAKAFSQVVPGVPGPNVAALCWMVGLGFAAAIVMATLSWAQEEEAGMVTDDAVHAGDAP